MALYGASSTKKYEAVTPPSIRKSLPVINVPTGPMRRAATLATSSGVPALPTGAKLNYATVTFSARTGQLIFREWCDNNPRTNRIDYRIDL